MYSSRKDSVDRHIRKFHPGDAIIISFVEYLAGLQVELYPPPSRTTLKKDGKSYLDNSVDIFSEEYFKALARKAAEQNNSPSAAAMMQQHRIFYSSSAMPPFPRPPAANPANRNTKKRRRDYFGEPVDYDDDDVF